jgi:integrase
MAQSVDPTQPKVARVLAPQDAVDIGRRSAPLIILIGSVGEQSTLGCEVPVHLKCGRNGARDAAAILLAYRHGLRATELCSLRWSQYPCSAWTAKANKRVQFGYGLNYLIYIAAWPIEAGNQTSSDRITSAIGLSVSDDTIYRALKNLGFSHVMRSWAPVELGAGAGALEWQAPKIGFLIA